MSSEQNKVIARRIMEEGFVEGSLAVLDEFVAPEFLDHAAPPGLAPGREGTKQLFAMIRSAFPDLRVTIEDEIAEGDKVVQRATTNGTMKGEYQGIPPTGKQATWTEMHILRFAGGRAVEHWANFDELGMLQQLGVNPPPRESGS